MLILSHPTGNQFVRALAHGAVRRNLLLRYVTTVKWGRRALGLPEALIDTRPLRESVRLFAQRADWNWLTRHERGWACIDAVFRDLDEYVAGSLDGASTVYAYEDGALATFAAAREKGIRCIYDLPIAYWQTVQQVLNEEAQRRPDWELTLVATRDSGEKLERKTSEIQAADLVVCPSEFVRRTLPEGVRSLVVPFGSPASRPIQLERKGPLRVLFAGSMTQRKGLADVFDAMQLLAAKESVQLVIMGAAVAPLEFYRSKYPGFEYHPPCAHNEVLTIMRGCDILVLPSLIEGRALVQQEAMACGLPIVVTANAGGEDLVQDGTGFLVPIRSAESIAAKIEWFATHREHLPEMRKAAQQRAECYTWEQYAAKILDAIDGSL